MRDAAVTRDATVGREENSTGFGTNELYRFHQWFYGKLGAPPQFESPSQSYLEMFKEQDLILPHRPGTKAMYGVEYDFCRHTSASSSRRRARPLPSGSLTASSTQWASQAESSSAIRGWKCLSLSPTTSPACLPAATCTLRAPTHPATTAPAPSGRATAPPSGRTSSYRPARVRSSTTLGAQVAATCVPP